MIIHAENMALQLKQYKRNLSKSSETDIFHTPWGGVVCRNCDDLGDFLSFKSVAAYKGEEKPLWLHLPLFLFRDNVSQYNGLVFNRFNCQTPNQVFS